MGKEFSDVARRVLRKVFECRAQLSGTRFYCNALSGDAGYNIAINSDLSVSCNCQDYDGAGQLGNLRTASMAEIFAGPIARRFREHLAVGRLPLPTCARCQELRSGSPAECERHVSEFSLPSRGLMVENTVLCNLRCLGCFRRDVMQIRKRPSMSLQDMRIVAQTLRDCHVQAVYFFNLGEPFSAPRILDELRLICELNPGIAIRVSTNGVLLDSAAKREAALLCDAITVSLDGGTQESCEAYQVGMQFERAVENMKAVAQLRAHRGLDRPVLVWKYVLFNWNDSPALVRKAIDRARSAGFDELLLWPTWRPLRGLSLRYHVDPELRAMGQRHGRLPPSAFTRIDLRTAR